MAKMDRLLNLIAALLDTAVPLTAEEIRRRVPGYAEDPSAFHRAFERDKDDLREMGVPLETLNVDYLEQPKAGYRILRDKYELPDPGFTSEELAALHLATTAVRLEGLDTERAEQGLRKLGGFIGETAGPGEPVGSVPVSDVLVELFAATIESRQVSFEYGDLPRRVEPHRLQFERGRWYVSGNDLDRDAPRSFRVDRIQGVVSAGPRNAFERPDNPRGVLTMPWELGDSAPKVVEVLIDRGPAQAILGEFPSLTVVEEHDDGSLVVQLAVRNFDGLRTFMANLLERAEVVAPADVRADIARWLIGVAGTQLVSDDSDSAVYDSVGVPTMDRMEQK